MKDEDRTKEQHITELAELRQRIAELEASETERKQAEDALRLSEIRFRSLIEQTTDAVFCYEYDPPIPTDLPVKEQVKLLYRGVLVECNDVSARSYGATRAEEVVGRKLTELFGTSPGSLDDLFRTFIQNGYRTVDAEGTEVLDDGTERYYLNNGHGVVEDGMLVRVWGTFRDITERVRAEEALRASEERYRLLVENAHDAIVVVQDGIIKFFNTRTAEVSGYSSEELASAPIADLIHPDDLQWVLERHLARLEGREVPSTYSYRVVHKDGSTIWVEINVVVIEWEGRPATLGFFSDITERKQAEEALRESEERFRQMAELSPFPVSIVDPAGRYEYVNSKFIEVFGYTLEDVPNGREWFARAYPDPAYRQEVISAWLSDLEKLGEYEVRPQAFSVTCKDGTVREVLFRPVTMKDGRQFVIYEDITERKRAEEALRESEERYRIVSETVSDWAYADRIEPNGAIVPEWTTEAITRAIGFKPDEVHAHDSWLDFVYADDHPIVHEKMETLLSGKSYVSEYRIITKSGQIRWARDHAHPVWDQASGRFVRVYGAMQDITERKRAEEALQESEERFRQFFENEPEYCYMISPQGVILDVNSAALKALGYKKEELVGKPLKTIYAPESLPRMKQLLAKWKETGELRDEEMVIITKEGDTRTILLSASVMRDKDGKVLHSVSVQKDITERKRADNLIRTQRDLGLALSAAPGLDEGLRLCVEAALHVSEMDCGGVYLVDETSGALDLVVHKGLPPGFVRSASHYDADSANARLVMAGKPIYTEHLELGVPLDETERRENLRAIAVLPMRHEDRVIGCLNIASHTLDEVPVFSRVALETIATRIGSAIAHLRAEEALRESEERYRTLVETADDTILLTDLNGKHIFRNSAYYTSLGFEVGEDVDLNGFSRVHPDDAPLIRSKMRELLENGTLTTEYRVRHKDGHWVDRFAKSTVVYDDAHQPKAILAIIRDITERKRAEEALQRSLEETARSQRLLLALSQATQAVQRARTPDEVYQTVGDEVTRLGYHAIVFSLTDDRAHLSITHMTFQPALLRAAEKLTGLSAQTYRVPLAQAPVFQRILSEGETSFDPPTADFMAGGLPERVRPLAGRIVSMLGLEQSITAPLLVGSEAHGLLMVTGAGLTEADVPAVTAFANQAAIALENARLYEQVQRHAEELEQRVADRTRELSVLYEVAAVASQPLDLETTLARSLDRVMEAMDSDAGAVHLLDEANGASGGETLHLVVQRGLPPDLVAQIDSIPSNKGLVGWVIEHGEPLIVPDVVSDPRTLHSSLIGPRIFVGVPIQARGQTVGVFSVLREMAQPQFTEEEVTLLTSIADQVGVVVESARLRGLAEQAVVLEERGRLARELHDSVTQSLYSVTLLAETGRRSAKAGDLEGVAGYLGRLGEVALEALKEMRLLVYELRPPALEREGLVGALQQRLDAVEGRAGVEARLLVKGEGRLAAPVEEALYRIALEALNNALKHAAATSVTVRIRADRERAELEVADNGRGFDPQAVRDTGGMGLVTMRERAERLGGALMILSRPGEGTRVKVSIGVHRNS